VAEQPEREAIVLKSDKPDAEAHKAFLERIRESAGVIDEKREEKVEAAQTPREAVFAMYIRKFWKQATWMVMMLAFPDGKSLIEQNQYHLALWNIFINAINRRTYGDKQQAESELDF
jgi:leucyl aminopeptidase (aminopeptidase T)